MAAKLNPWKEIKLEDYEGHMKYEGVEQLQMLNDIMRDSEE